jgi:hypothetical protein
VLWHPSSTDAQATATFIAPKVADDTKPRKAECVIALTLPACNPVASKANTDWPGVSKGAAAMKPMRRCVDHPLRAGFDPVIGSALVIAADRLAKRSQSAHPPARPEADFGQRDHSFIDSGFCADIAEPGTNTENTQHQPLPPPAKR